MVSFEDIYKNSYQKMFCIAKKIVNDEDVVNDIVQEIFICYYEKLQNGSSIDSPQSWLVKATINKCIDHLNRKKKHIKITTIDQVDEEDQSVEIQQSNAILRQALLELKPQEMNLILLYSEGFSYKEISQIAGINFSSIGKTLSRTLKKLKDILKKLNYEMY